MCARAHLTNSFFSRHLNKATRLSHNERKWPRKHFVIIHAVVITQSFIVTKLLFIVIILLFIVLTALFVV